MKRPWMCFLPGAACLVGFLGTVTLAIVDDREGGNMYIHQARAFLEGRLDLRERMHDVSVFRNRCYVPFPPVPALLLVPYAACSQRPRATMVAGILTLINVYTLRRIFRNLRIDSTPAAWLSAAFFLGTAYWNAVTWSWGVWFFAHVVSVTFMLAAIGEALGAGRGVRTGLFLGCACLSRQLSVFSSVFLLAGLWTNPHNRRMRARCLRTLGFLVSLGVCLGAYCVFNRARFGRYFDTGYSYVLLDGFLGERYERYGLFHPAYFLFNFVHMFLQGPHLEFRDGLVPVGMDLFGTSLILASPFVILSLFADRRLLLVRGAWASVLLTLVPLLFYHNNGWGQVNGQRFTLDFLPVLMVLTALSVREARQGLFRAFTVWAILLNTIALLVLPLLQRAG